MDSTVAMVKDGRISETQVDESVRRILRLKERYGLLDRNDFTTGEEQIMQAFQTPFHGDRVIEDKVGFH